MDRKRGREGGRKSAHWTTDLVQSVVFTVVDKIDRMFIINLQCCIVLGACRNSKS